MTKIQHSIARRVLAPFFALALLGLSGCYKDALDEATIASRGAAIALNGYSPIGAVNAGDTTYAWYYNWTTGRWVKFATTSYGTTTAHQGNYDWVYFDFGSKVVPSAGWRWESNRYHARVVVQRTEPTWILVTETWAMTQPEKDCAQNYINNGGDYVQLNTVCGADTILDQYATQ